MANIKDGATGTVLTAPFPQSSGTSFVLNSGEGARFPIPPFWAIAGPNNGLPLVSVAEKILVTAVSTDTFTIVRAQGIYTAKNIDVGWRISNAIFQDDLNNASIIKNEVPVGSINGSNPTFTLASSVHTAGSLEVYKNGIRLKGDGADYTETATGFTMVTAPTTGTVILVDYIVAGAIQNVGTNSIIVGEVPSGIVDGSNAIFTAPRAYIAGSLEVFINGLSQARTTHFVETTPSTGTFTMSDAPLTGDVITINYQFNLNPSSNADTVDGKHASELSQVGDLIMSMRTAPGTNRLFMAGGTYNKADYPSLWALNTSHPAYFTASASLTFTLADMRQRVPVGKDAATFATLGATGGEEAHSLTLAENGPHTHGHSTAQYVVAGNAGANDRTQPSSGTNAGFIDMRTTSSSGSGTPHNNLQPYIVINYEVVAA